MQAAMHRIDPRPIPLSRPATDSLSPAAMAMHLRRVSGDAALCFAQAMHDGAAWANEDWGDYWSAVIRRM